MHEVLVASDILGRAPSADDPVAFNRRLSDFRLACRQRAIAVERVWGEPAVVAHDIRIEPPQRARSSALVRRDGPIREAVAVGLFPDITVAIDSIND